ncbi:MAG: hypothetical protein HN368_03415, partial [Spirochaetales bacterium]|nr:hypothetical protein [Spirochaetales bacterium]
VQVSKLPGAIEKRRAVAEKIRGGLEGHAGINMGWQVADTEGVYWFMRIHIDEKKLTVGKAEFCKALAAEGIPVNPEYRHIPAEAIWHKERQTFGQSGFPWSADDYQGTGTAVFELPNAIKAAQEHFNIHFHERYGEREADDILAALCKVETAFLK